MMARPSPYMMAPAHSTRTVPKRSAIAPANGCPTPHNRFWMANAIENTSRPQPLANDSGVRNWPAAERGPNESMPIRQPQRTIMAGVRQVSTTEAGLNALGSAVAMEILLVPSQHRGSLGATQRNLRTEDASPGRMA